MDLKVAHPPLRYPRRRVAIRIRPLPRIIPGCTELNGVNILGLLFNKDPAVDNWGQYAMIFDVIH